MFLRVDECSNEGLGPLPVPRYLVHEEDAGSLDPKIEGPPLGRYYM